MIPMKHIQKVEGYDGKPITSRMINNVANYIPRTTIIIREVQKNYGRIW